MTEEEAIEFWRELAPYTATVLRNTLAPKDEPTFTVHLKADALSGKQLAAAIKRAADRGIGSAVSVENGSATLEFKRERE